MLLATVLATSMVTAAGTVAEGARVEVASQVDAHWRGAYDLLVRSHDSHLGLEETAGVVEPNFLGFTGNGGITLDQLAAIRSIGDVDVAAPVAFIGMLSTPSASTTLHIPSTPQTATLYEVTIRVTTSDGLDERLVDATTVRIVLGPGSAPGQPLAATDQPGTSLNVSPDGTIDIGTTSFLPPFESPIVAVDPVAERSLLDMAGAFLEPLVEVSAAGPFTASTFDQSVMLSGFDARARIGILQKGTPTMHERPVFPVLVSSHVYAPLSASMAVLQLGHPFTADLSSSNGSVALDEALRLAGPGRTSVGSITRDLTDDMRPLRTNSVTLAWPGSTTGIGPVQFRSPTEFMDQLALRPSYALDVSEGDGPLRFVIQPLGVVGPGGAPLPPAASPRTASSETGSEQAYRSVTTIAVPLMADFIPSDAGDQPFVLAPVGEFDLDTLNLPSDPLSYVPFGVYDPPNTTYVEDASGKPVTPRAMTPTLNPRGLLQMPPLAIADLSAAVAFRGPAPIDAIRVRLAGLAGFDADAKVKVDRVASQIVAMGLEVDVVAGSSPQTVEVFVPAYDTSTSPPGDLGWVEQQWTTLGAATRVVRGLGDTNAALLGVAILAILVVIGGVEVLFAATRRRDAAVLAAVGWSRAARVRWQAGEAMAAGIVVTVIGAVSWAVAGRSPTALLVVLIIGAAFPVAGILASLAVPVNAGMVVGGRQVSRLLRRIPVDGLTAFSLRSLAARPARAVVTVLAFGAAAATTGPALGLVATVGMRVGPTRLAGAVSAQLAPYQLVLLGLAAAGSIAFSVVALRSARAERTDELTILVAAGWLPAQVRGLLRRERILIAVPAALLGSSIAWTVAGTLPGANPTAGAALAAALALSMAGWGELVSRPPGLRSARGAP